MYLLFISALIMYCEEPGAELRALMVTNNTPGHFPSFETPGFRAGVIFQTPVKTCILFRTFLTAITTSLLFRV
jgi:hypothetical protein